MLEFMHEDFSILYFSWAFSSTLLWEGTSVSLEVTSYCLWSDHEIFSNNLNNKGLMTLKPSSAPLHVVYAVTLRVCLASNFFQKPRYESSKQRVHIISNGNIKSASTLLPTGCSLNFICGSRDP